MTEKITKSSYISIGLAIVLAMWIFWSGIAIGEMRKQLEYQRGALERFVPRSELEVRMSAIEVRLNEIKITQKEILKELRNDKP